MRKYHYIALLFIAVSAFVFYLCYTDVIDWMWFTGLLLAYVIFLYFAVTQIRWNYYISSYNKGYSTDKIALTFDDGPNSQTAAILDILKEQGVRATFFCIGKQVEANQVLAMRMYDEGHLVGNHSHLHTHSFDWMSTHRMKEEIEECNTAIRRITGRNNRLFRPPYGITNPNLDRAVRGTNMVSIGWSLRSFDTMTKDPKKLLQRLMKKLKGGDIVLLHDSEGVTREILTEFIASARKKGFTFVRIDQLLDIQPYA